MHSCILIVRLIAENADWDGILGEWDLNEIRGGERSGSNQGDESLDKSF